MTATLPRVEGRIEIIYTSDTPAGNTKVITFTDKIRCTMEGMREGVGERRRGGGEERWCWIFGGSSPKTTFVHLQQHSETAQTPCRPSRRGVRHHGVGGATQDGRGHTGGGGGEEGVNGSASAWQDGRGHLVTPPRFHFPRRHPQPMKPLPHPQPPPPPPARAPPTHHALAAL